MKTIFTRLQNKNEALKIIKYTALFNFVVGCFSVLWAFTSDKMYLLDAMALFVIVYWFWKRHSRAAAFLLLYFPAFDILYFLKAIITNTPYQYQRWWLIVYVALVLFDIRGIEATYKLYKFSSEDNNEKAESFHGIA